MDTNPYRYDPSIDDDIFDTVETPSPSLQNHPGDGTICPECSIIHDFSGIPEEKQKELFEALERLPSFVAKEILATHEYENVPAKMVASFFSYAHKLDSFDKSMPLIRSLVAVVDRISNGEVSALYHLFLVEQDLLVAHQALQSANNAQELAMASEETPLTRDFLHGMQFLVEIMTDRIQDLGDTYRQVCQQFNIEPNEELLFQGSIIGSSDIALHLTKSWLLDL